MDGDIGVRQRLKVVSLLNVEMGKTLSTAEVRPIVIVTLGWQGEVEEPLAITLPDAKRMALGMLRAVARFGDEAATAIVEQILGEDVPAPIDLHAPIEEQSQRSTLIVRLQSGTELRFTVLAGYRSKSTCMMLVASVDFDGAPTLVRVSSKHVVRFRDHRSDERLPESEWDKLPQMKAGHWIKLGTRHWKVLCGQELDERISTKRFTCKS